MILPRRNARAFWLRRFARAPDRVLDERQRLREPRRPPALAMSEEHRLALEMGAGPERPHSVLETTAGALDRRHAMKLGKVPPKRSERRGIVGASSGEALKLAERNGGIATAGGIDEILERGLCCIAHDRIDVIPTDALFAGG